MLYASLQYCKYDIAMIPNSISADIEDKKHNESWECSSTHAYLCLLQHSTKGHLEVKKKYIIPSPRHKGQGHSNETQVRIKVWLLS